MAGEETNEPKIEKAVYNRLVSRGLDLYDTAMLHGIQTSQFFMTTSALNFTEQQRNIVEYTSRESKSDVATLTESHRNNNAADTASMLKMIGASYGDNGMQYRYASGNPKVPA